MRKGGRLAFTTILVAPGLDREGRLAAVRAGPSAVATREPYADMIARAGFGDVEEVDFTAAYEATERARIEESERRADILRLIVSGFDERQADRRAALAAIETGLLRRSLFTARNDR